MTSNTETFWNDPVLGGADKWTLDLLRSGKWHLVESSEPRLVHKVSGEGSSPMTPPTMARLRPYLVKSGRHMLGFDLYSASETKLCKEAA
jgi:hypothetical protein